MKIGCIVCGGKGFLQAAPVKRDPNAQSRPQWHEAAVVPCFSCTGGRVFFGSPQLPASYGRSK